MATFNGVDLFGSVCEVSTTFAPRRRQVTRYPGVGGKVWKDMGDDGGVSTVVGWIFASDTYTLSTIETTINTIQQAGIPGVFVDNYGRSIGNTLLESFEPSGRIMQCTAGFCRQFKCIFLHMS